MRNEEILRRVKKEAKEIEIPESLRPEQMRRRLERQKVSEALGESKVTEHAEVSWKGLAVAVCLCLVLGGSLLAWYPRSAKGPVILDTNEEQDAEMTSPAQNEDQVEETGFGYPQITYEDIYASMLPVWEDRYVYTRDIMEMSAEETPMAGAAVEKMTDSVAAGTASQKKMNVAADFGETNVQTAGVEEGDIVKNDGRYLYQIVDIENEEGHAQAVQIVDTKDGLKQVCSLQEFDSISEFYVWEDTLIVIENKYQYQDIAVTPRKAMLELACGVGYERNEWHEISFYDMKDHSRPEKIKTFTLQGRYASSRIADGYFYGFSRFYADLSGGEKNYDAYVPIVDGVRLQADQILLPEENAGTSYLVLVSVDLTDPTEFVQTTAVVSPAEQYYVSEDHIYVTSTLPMEEMEGWGSDRTSVRKFSYGNGMFAYQTKTEIKGQLDDNFSLDEYDGHLRAVTTVHEYQKKLLVDDRTGETIGSEILNDKQTNALYVLDENMQMTGSIEGLAEDEQIYSARFMGDTGYFVTFRQTDPLFAVDLSDPAKPEVLSELKVSGFSDYLHFYGEDRLLGIGMEADEETGRQEGLKLSMFDISDPANVQEIARLHLKDYYHSEALYNHKAVMISTDANLFGFEVEGSQRGDYRRHYLLFSYEDEKFVEELTLDVKNEEGKYYSARGTFIGDTIYILSRDGSVRSYDRETKKQLESLEP